MTAPRPYAGGDVLPSTAWHAEFQDVNNDGFVDLFVTKGNVEAMPDFAAKDPSNLMLGNADGTFTESGEAAGIVSLHPRPWRGRRRPQPRRDARPRRGEPPRGRELWRNVGGATPTQPAPMGDWVAVRLQQPGPNRDAIGAWIEVRTGDRTTQREVDDRRRPRERRARLDPLRALGGADDAADPRALAGRRGRDRGSSCRRIGSRRSSAERRHR